MNFSTKKMKQITIFCGSSLGNEAVFAEQAKILGKKLVEQKIDLVYGAAKIGIMGAIADSVLEAGGKVIGVIPTFLKTKEVAHDGLTQLIVVDTMHQRKTIMNELCDGIIALPGGFGTLEELFEVLTWAQLGLHQKPIGLLNTNGFYDPLIALIQTTVDKGFLKDLDQERLLVSDNSEELLQKMNSYQAPLVGKWINKDTL
jgi:uncharacterized protein (TIGR00730 family)